MKYKKFFQGLFVFQIINILFLHSRIEGVDEEHYLSWGNSVFFDADLILLNQFEVIGLPYHLTPTGYINEIRNFGIAFLWWPFYWLYHFITGNFSQSVETVPDPLLVILINWADLLFILLALMFIAATLYRYFSKNVILSSLGIVLLGTPLFVYVIQKTISSHPGSIFFTALFLYLWSQQLRSDIRVFCSGILIGWAMFIATYNFALIAIPVTALVSELWRNKNWRRTSWHGLLLAAGSVLGFLPQMLVWRAFFGSMFASPYGGQLYWSQPQIIPTLFSSFQGLFIFSPILLLCIVGLVLFSYYDKTLAIGIGISWALLVYIVSANRAWWAGPSFGNRYFLALTPFFVLMVGTLLQHNRRWLWLFLPGVVWSIGLWVQTITGLLDLEYTSYKPFGTLVKNQFNVIQQPWPFSQFTSGHWFSLAPLPLIIGILFASALIYCCAYVVLRNSSKRFPETMGAFFLALALLAIFATVFLLQRSEQKRTALAAQGFYEQPHRVSHYDPLNSIRDYVARAQYFESVGLPKLAFENYQSAAKSWFTSSRELLGTMKDAGIEPDYPLDIAFGSELRLLGYSATGQSHHIELKLFWEKLEPTSDFTYSPYVELLDKTGKILAHTWANDPLPARFIPPGYLFSDTLILKTAQSDQLHRSLWLKVTFPNEQVLPVEVKGKQHRGIVPFINYFLQKPMPDGSVAHVVDNGEDKVYPGTPFVLTLAWNPAKLTAPPPLITEVRFTNTKGQVVFKDRVSILAGGAIRIPAHARNPLLDTICLDIPPRLPGGQYKVDFKIGHIYEPIIIISVQSPASYFYPERSICSQIDPDNSQHKYLMSSFGSAKVSFAGMFDLLDYRRTVVINDNEALVRLDFTWYSRENNPPNAQPQVRLENEAGETVLFYTWIPDQNSRPTIYWFNDEIIRDTVWVPVTEVEPGDYRLLLEWKLVNTNRFIPTQSGQLTYNLEDFTKP